MYADTDILNEQFAIPGHVTMQAGPGDLTMAVVNNVHAAATMTLAGGHVMTYTPHGGSPVLWVSPNSAHEVGKAMRGGVPICWPWFGAHPENPRGNPPHGLVRTMCWALAGTRALPDGSTEVRMRVSDTPAALAAWPHPFTLEVTATFGRRLRVEWSAGNPGSLPYTYTGAMHPYYTISDSRAVTVRGLDGCDYLDKNEDFRRKHLDGDLKLAGPVDAVFLDTTGEVVVEDPGLNRDLHIRKGGSRTTVVWNPHEKDTLSADIGAGQHRHFLCVEAANAFDDRVTVEPDTQGGAPGSLMMEIWAEPR